MQDDTKNAIQKRSHLCWEFGLCLDASSSCNILPNFKLYKLHKPAFVYRIMNRMNVIFENWIEILIWN